MKRTIPEKQWYLIKSQRPGTLADNQWIHSYRVGTQFGPRIDGSRQMQVPLAQPQLVAALATAGVVQPAKTQAQIAALGTWEDEGGTTIAPARKIDGNRPPAEPT